MRALTMEQQELVSRHVALVRMQVRRQLQRLPADLRRREQEDLVQEGMLGLMRAAGGYEPPRCGPFAPYALAYIHGAVCRYLLQQMDGLAMPTTQAKEVVRQRQRAAVQAELLAAGLGVAEGAAGETAERLPRFYELEVSGAALAEVAQRRDREQAREAADAGEGGEAGWTVEQLHAQCEQALAWAIGRVKATPGVKIDHAVLVEAVVQERLRVPDRQFRTSRRTLARRFGCSPTRVWNLELRLVRLVQRRLAGEAGISQAADTLVFQGRRSRGKASGEAVVSRAAAGLVCPVGRVVRWRGAPLSERDVLGAGGSLQIRY